MTTQRHVVLISIFAIGGVFLSACTGRPPEAEQPNFKLQAQSQSQTQTGQTQISNYNNQTNTPTDQAQGAEQVNPPQPVQSDQSQPANPQGQPMKTLADFPEKIKASEATIHTNKGDITFTLYQDKEPLTVLNFLTLAKSGFYNGIKFHRIIADFMAQVGDPLTKDDSKKDMWGTGGPGYTIQDEFDPSLKHDSEGIVSMANTGMPNTGGSQIFITYGPTPWLDGKHPIFGKVTTGMDVLRKLEIGDQITSVTYK